VCERQLALLFSMQGVGKLLCALVLLIAASSIQDTNVQWRFAIIMGQFVPRDTHMLNTHTAYTHPLRPIILTTSP
jgi:hypothetical protein